MPSARTLCSRISPVLGAPAAALLLCLVVVACGGSDGALAESTTPPSPGITTPAATMPTAAASPADSPEPSAGLPEITPSQDGPQGPGQLVTDASAADTFRASLAAGGLVPGPTTETVLGLAPGICAQLAAGATDEAVTNNLLPIAAVDAAATEGKLSSSEVAALYVSASRAAYCPN